MGFYRSLPRTGIVLLAACLVAGVARGRLQARDFIRGEVNGDAAVDISDPVAILHYLFTGGEVPSCLKAADVSDSGGVDISDAVYLLLFLFVDGSPPPPPYPDPGEDPTPDDLPCGAPPVTGLSATPSPATLSQVGETVQLHVTAMVDGTATDLTAGAAGTTYGSDDQGVVLAYRDGLVEAKGKGSATVTVRNGEAEAAVTVTVKNDGSSSTFKVLAVNDLGMHCIDREFSIYSILPPFNVVHAQVIRLAAGGFPVIIDSGDVVLRYSPVQDSTGSINSHSASKTDFWAHASELFGADLEPGQGLLGFYMPDDAPSPGPQAIPYDPAHGWFSADGIPATDRDDAGAVFPYPMLRISAFDKTTGAFLARTDIVVPVSSETDCQNCHATGAIAAPPSGLPWAMDADLEVQTKKNVLILHDDKHGTNLAGQTPVLCARCHYSAALDLAGEGPQGIQLDLPSFSHVMHGFHGALTDGGGNPVFPPDGDVASTCYQCHPGANTRCLRGAMANGGLECKNCHGGMPAVGGTFPLAAGGSLDGQADGKSRRPWVDLPRCQSCHTGDALQHLSGAGLVPAPGGIRLAQAYRTGDAAASPIRAQNLRFAENPNTLYRFSKGHSGIACENCHGSTHSEWPNADASANDNVAASQLQGHTGKITECDACHARGTLPLTLGGPHGMHNVNDHRWTDDGHEDFFERNPQACKTCHGADLRGTVLSRAAVDRNYRVEDFTVHVAKGQKVPCNLCHGFPDEEDDD